jgi:hypothetical protein
MNYYSFVVPHGSIYHPRIRGAQRRLAIFEVLDHQAEYH